MFGVTLFLATSTLRGRIGGTAAALAGRRLMTGLAWVFRGDGDRLMALL